MAKTIRLLATYNGFKRGDIITLDDATADKLLLGGVSATLDLTGGTEAFQPSPGTGLSSATNLPNPQTITSGQTTIVTVPAGVALSMQGTSNVQGTRQILNPDDTVASTDPLVSGVDTIGVFLRDTKVRIAVTFGSVDVAPKVTGGDVSLDTLLAGEDLLFDVQKFLPGAGQGVNVLPGRTDYMLGSIGAETDYLRDVLAVVSISADSRVVLKEGTPLPAKTINTHGATASTTTVINTANNPDSVAADQYRDYLVRVGNGPYRKIGTHPAFAPGAVNSFTLDQALPSAPAVNTAIFIENPTWVAEIVPMGAPVGTHLIAINRHCRGNGWRPSTGTGVSLVTSGNFDNVVGA